MVIFLYILEKNSVKLFLWRALRDYLPTKVRLHERDIDIPSICAWYKKEMENLWHTFMNYTENQKCWRHVSLDILINYLSVQALGFKDLCFSMLKSCDSKMREMFTMVLWSLWKNKNNTLWNNETMNHTQILSRARKVLVDWQLAKGLNKELPLSVVHNKIHISIF